MVGVLGQRIRRRPLSARAVRRTAIRSRRAVRGTGRRVTRAVLRRRR